jgi:hypothetical protein
MLRERPRRLVPLAAQDAADQKRKARPWKKGMEGAQAGPLFNQSWPVSEDKATLLTLPHLRRRDRRSHACALTAPNRNVLATTVGALGTIAAGLFFYHRALLNHLIRPQQQRGRDREAEPFGGLEVDHQLELRGLLDRKIGGLSTLDDLIDVSGGETP